VSNYLCPPPYSIAHLDKTAHADQVALGHRYGVFKGRVSNTSATLVMAFRSGIEASRWVWGLVDRTKRVEPPTVIDEASEKRLKQAREDAGRRTG
jgi:hypothetical protein